MPTVGWGPGSPPRPDGPPAAEVGSGGGVPNPSPRTEPRVPPDVSPGRVRVGRSPASPQTSVRVRVGRRKGPHLIFAFQALKSAKQTPVIIPFA